MFIEIGFKEAWALKNLYSNDVIFKELVKTVETYTVKFNVRNKGKKYKQYHFQTEELAHKTL